MTKKELRKKARELRDSLDREEVIRLSGIIQDMVCRHPWFAESSTVFTYVSTGNEVMTGDIIEKALKAGKRVCVPRVVPGVKMEVVPIKNLGHDLQPGFFNIMEPRPELPPVSEDQADLVIVPGLVFDRRGYRIGYGGGYYDRFLLKTANNCRIIGIAYDFQIVEKLPADEHDMRVMAVITERGIIYC